MMLAIVLFLLGLIGAFVSGMLGIGGAILFYPLLFYVPAWLGVASFSALEVSSISMFQALFASFAGALAYRSQRTKGGSRWMNAELVLYMGTSMLAGSLLGAFGSVYLPQSLIHFVYGTMATIAAAFMIIPKKKKERAFGEQISFHKPLAVGLAFGIGVVSGIVGAGGAFMLIPVMLTALNIPTRVAIASSLAIVFMSSIGGAIGKWATGQVPYGAVAFTVLGSLIGAPLGSMVGRRMSVGALRWALALFIVCAAAKTWLDMI